MAEKFTFLADNGQEVTVRAESVKVNEYEDGTRHLVFTNSNGLEEGYGGSIEWGQSIPQSLIDAAGGITKFPKGG